MKKFILIALTCSGMSVFAQQEKHYSMFGAAPSLLNPAATATMNQDAQVFTNFRMQWLTSVEQAFRSNSFTGEMKLFKKKLKNSYFGSGLHFTNDATGNAKIATTSVYVPINYVIMTENDGLFSVGIQPGFVQQKRGGNYTWNNQWTGMEFNSALPSGEFADESAAVLDMGGGVFFKQPFGDANSSFHVGAAVNHITTPNLFFYAGSKDLYRRYTFHAGAQVRFRQSYVGFSPQFYSFFQGPSTNMVFGSSVDFLLQESSRRTIFVDEKSFSIGLYHRWKDALIASVSFRYSEWQIGLSYDATVSGYRGANKSLGAFELFLKYSFLYDKNRRFIR